MQGEVHNLKKYKKNKKKTKKTKTGNIYGFGASWAVWNDIGVEGYRHDWDEGVKNDVLLALGFEESKKEFTYKNLRSSGEEEHGSVLPIVVSKVLLSFVYHFFYLAIGWVLKADYLVHLLSRALVR